MDELVQILHLEDQPDFSALVSALLEREGLEAETVAVTEFAAFTAALAPGKFDIIIADYSLPTCNGMQALQAAKQKCPETPFLLLSGAIGEHAAVDILRAGATDYVLKSSLERLVPAIRRAVQENRGRSKLKHAEAEARVSERQYHVIFNGSPVPMWVSDLKTGVFLEVNEAAIRHYGYPREQFLAMKIRDITLPEEAARLAQYVISAAGKRHDPEIGRVGICRHRRKNGSFIEVDVTWSVIQFQEHQALLTIANDVTEMKPATEMLKKSEARLAAAQRIARLGSWELDLTDLEHLDRNKLVCSEETIRILGFQSGRLPVPSEFFFNPVHPEDMRRVKETLKQAFRTLQPYEVLHRVLLADGTARFVRARAEFVLDSAGKPVQLRGVVMDITQQQQPARPTVPAAAPAPTSTATPTAAAPEEKPVIRTAAAKPAKPAAKPVKKVAARAKR